MSIQLNILLNVALFQSYREDVASLLNLLFKPLDQKRPNAFQKKTAEKKHSFATQSKSKAKFEKKDFDELYCNITRKFKSKGYY